MTDHAGPDTQGIPSSRTARRGAIVDILADQQISSQKELREALAVLGIETTQATLSRDLVEMRATKIRTASGKQVYSVPDLDGEQTRRGEESLARLERWAQDLLVAVDTAGTFLVVRTPVGAANLLGSAIDTARLEGVVGTVAGDDTIFVACRSTEDAVELQSTLIALVEPRQ
ncbi:MAG: arginine repressor [Actinomyces sp.]|nr:arginine repressor [Actinomyces sp.]